MRNALSALFPFCDSLNRAAGFQRHLIEVHLDGVFDDSPFRAIFMLREAMKLRQSRRPNSEEAAGIVPDALRFMLCS